MKSSKTIDELNLTNYSLWNNVLYCLKNTAICYFPLLCQCSILIVLNVSLPILTAYLPKAVVERFTDRRSLSELAAIVFGFMGGIALLSGAKRFFTKYISFQKLQMNTFYLKRVAMKGLTTDYSNQENERFRKLQTESLACCDGNSSPLTKIYDILIDICTSLLGLSVFSGILSCLNPGLIALLAVTAIISFFLNKRLMKWLAEHNPERIGYRQRTDYINRISGDIRSAKDIRIYHMSAWFSDLYDENMKGLAGWYGRFTSRLFGVAVWDSTLSLVREGAAYIYLLSLVLENRITVAEFVLYFEVIAGFSTWFGAVMTQIASLAGLSQRINYFRSYLQYPENYRRDNGIMPPADVLPKTITLKNVSYKYEGAAQYTLRNINLEITPGEHLAIVGLNGAGKTTLVKLICGLSEPTEGSVLYDGIDIREYNRTEFYRLFSAVFQQFSIMPVTIAEIVAETPSEHIDLIKVRHCLDQAGLWDKIALLPKGMDSEFGKIIHDDGVEFSGGEIQKLLLARALYKSAPIMLLDEPTAALDPIAESSLYESYHQISNGRTAFFISHRLASTSFCDRVLLLEDGVIQEEGTHEELLAQKGRYYDLFETQAAYYRSAKEGNLF